MKFLCVDCDVQMLFDERQIPGDGTMAAVFRCPRCQRLTAMLTNPMETRLVSSLGVKVGGRGVPEQPLEMVRSGLEGGREDAFRDAEPDTAGTAPESGSPSRAEPTAPAAGGVRWSGPAVERLERVPSFVRGMVKRIYADWATRRGVEEITPEVMDRARRELGLEGM